MPIKTSIAFGLVYIPVSLTPAVKSRDIGFNLLHKETHKRVRYVKTVPGVGEIENDEIVKGYEYEKGKYVVFEDEDFEKLKSEKDKTIEIEQFVPIADIDPVLYDKAYYVAPTGGEKAFALLVGAMQQEKTVGIAKTVLGTKEAVVALFASDGKMRLNTLHFADEVAVNAAAAATTPGEKELALAKTLIDNMTGRFDAQAYTDGYRARVEKAIADKVAGREIATPDEAPPPHALDLMEALSRSVEATKKTAKKAAPYKRERKRA